MTSIAPGVVPNVGPATVEKLLGAGYTTFEQVAALENKQPVTDLIGGVAITNIVSWVSQHTPATPPPVETPPPAPVQSTPTPQAQQPDMQAIVQQAVAQAVAPLQQEVAYLKGKTESAQAQTPVEEKIHPDDFDVSVGYKPVTYISKKADKLSLTRKPRKRIENVSGVPQVIEKELPAIRFDGRTYVTKNQGEEDFLDAQIKSNPRIRQLIYKAFDDLDELAGDPKQNPLERKRIVQVTTVNTPRDLYQYGLTLVDSSTPFPIKQIRNIEDATFRLNTTLDWFRRFRGETFPNLKIASALSGNATLAQPPGTQSSAV